VNYYPFHIGDFRSGTVNMTRQTRWIYRDMLDIYYDDEKPLPLDLDLLCNQIGAESDDERRIVERLLRFKFVKTDDGYWHEICDRVITDYHKKAEIAQANGKLGGRPRKAVANETQSEANQEPITNNQNQKQKQGAPSALPDWMPLDSWAGYLEMRKKIKKAPTDRAVVLLIASLGKMRDDGQDIAAVLDKSTKSNWTDVYPIRGGQQTRAPPPQDPRFFGLAGLDRTGDRLAMDASMKRHGVVVGDDDDLSFDLPGRQNETNE
jgi:uncharacterized protein YdaU (DUF1376 family)